MKLKGVSKLLVFWGCVEDIAIHTYFAAYQDLRQDFQEGGSVRALPKAVGRGA